MTDTARLAEAIEALVEELRLQRLTQTPKRRRSRDPIPGKIHPEFVQVADEAIRKAGL